MPVGVSPKRARRFRREPAGTRGRVQRFRVASPVDRQRKCPAVQAELVQPREQRSGSIPASSMCAPAGRRLRNRRTRRGRSFRSPRESNRCAGVEAHEHGRQLTRQASRPATPATVPELGLADETVDKYDAPAASGSSVGRQDAFAFGPALRTIRHGRHVPDSPPANPRGAGRGASLHGGVYAVRRHVARQAYSRPPRHERGRVPRKSSLAPDPNVRYLAYAKLAKPRCYENNAQKGRSRPHVDREME